MAMILGAPLMCAQEVLALEILNVQILKEPMVVKTLEPQMVRAVSGGEEVKELEDLIGEVLEGKEEEVKE